MMAQEEANAMQYAASRDVQQVASPDQVSAIILAEPKRYLNWQYDKEQNKYYLDPKDSGLLEPYGDEPYSFVDAQKQEPELLLESELHMSAIRTYMQKYGKEPGALGLFNNYVRARQSVLVVSRTTGKPGKLAKSQFIDTTAAFARGNLPKPNKEGGMFGGLFG